MSATKCHANLHMTMAEHSLWEVCRSLAYQNDGIVRFDGRYLASLYEGTGKSSIYRTANGLVEKGWLKVVKEAVKDGRTGRYLSALYKVLSVDEWCEKFPHEHNSPVPESPSPKYGTGKPVPSTGTVQSQKRDSPVPKNANPVPSTGHSSDVDTEGRDFDSSSTARKAEKWSHPSLMTEIQEAASAITGSPTKVGPQDHTRAKALESKLGRKLLLKTWEVWLTNDENLYFSDSGADYREYLFKHFVESGMAEYLATRIAPVLEAGFNNPHAIGKIYLLNADIGDPSPDDIAALESTADLDDEYAAFCNKNHGGTLQGLAQVLKVRVKEGN